MNEKFNVLFIITDAQRADHLGCMGNSTVKTPNIDKLSKEGVIFNNYFCNNPICMPNRATLATGVYPNVHGVRSNGMKLRKDIPTIYQTLRKRGWHTKAIGKIHHQYWMAPFKHRYKSMEGLDEWADKEVTSSNFPLPYYGFEEVELVSGNGSLCIGHYLEWLEKKDPKTAKKMKKRVKNYDNLFSLFCDPIPEELYSTTYVRERTIDFLKRHSKGEYGEKPFFLHCSFPDPHYPLYPPKSYRDMYDWNDIDLPPTFDNIKKLYEHEFLGPLLKDPPFKKAFLRESTEEEVKKITALTYAAISYIDYSVGKILEFIENSGYKDNTIIIFTSDHGDLMGDHGLLFKGPCPFNGVLNIPLIWKTPGKKGKGVSESLISTIDIPKTLLNLLEIKERYQPPDMQGYDMNPLLEDPTKKIRNSIFIENDEEIGPLDSRLRHLITEDYKLTIYRSKPNFGDLYNRKDDPYELNNLWNNERIKDKKYEMIRICLNENLKAQTKYPKRIAGT